MVSICIIIKDLKKIYSHVVLFKVSGIYHYNMISSGVSIFHTFLKLQYLQLPSLVQFILSNGIEIASEQKLDKHLHSLTYRNIKESNQGTIPPTQ